MPRSVAFNREEEAVETTRLIEMDDDLHAEAQDNLTQASIGLTDALHRLQHLRNSLAELTGRSNLGVGPAHAAIVLSDTTAEDSNAVPDMQRLRSTVPSVIMERLEEYEANSRRHSASAGRAFASGTLQPLISRESLNNTLLLPPTSTQSTASRTQPTYRTPELALPARRSWLEASLSRYRDTDPDDGSTVLGRRVAARAAAGGGAPSDNSVPQLEQIFLNRTSEIARDLETAMNRMASQRAARLEQRANEAVLNAGSRATDNNSGGGGGGLANEDMVGTHMISQFPGRSANATRRWRFGQATDGTGQLPASAGPADMSHNSSAGSNPIYPPPRPVLHDERDSSSSSSVAAAIEQAREANNRSYLVRRRLNADGDEQVHNIEMMHWDEDDPMEWLMPPMNRPNTHDHPEALTAASMVSRNELSRVVVPRRRRGWGESSCSPFLCMLD
jgi:hypothetical protein